MSVVAIWVLVMGAAGGLFAWAASKTRSDHDRAVRAWASERGIAREGGGYRTFVDGIPVVIESGVSVRATARYPVGVGPTFTLTPPPANEPGPTNPDLRVQYSLRYEPAELAQRVRERYRRHGAASEAMPRVLDAIERHVHAPTTAPTFSSDGRAVRVEAQLAGAREQAVPDRIDVLAGLASSIAAHDLYLLVPFATAIGSRVEIGEDGLAFVGLPRRAGIRVTLLPSVPGSLVLATTVTGALEAGAADLALAAFEVRTPAPTEAAAWRPEARAALDALALLRDARVTVGPRAIRVQFPGHPPMDRLVRAADTLEVILGRGSASPFR